jgi:hypothetical protein
MTHKTLIHSLTAAAILSATFSVSAPTIANAGSHFTPPGIDLKPCILPGGCGPKLPPIGGGGIIMPPPPPGGGGGGGGGFGGGLGAGIGLGIGLGIVNSLNRPRTVVVQQPTYVQPVQSGLHPHDQFCLGKYKSYNINTKQYLSYSGVFKYCNSPYM